MLPCTVDASDGLMQRLEAVAMGPKFQVMTYSEAVSTLQESGEVDLSFQRTFYFLDVIVFLI